MESCIVDLKVLLVICQFDFEKSTGGGANWVSTRVVL